MPIKVNEDNLKEGLLGLVVTLVEVIEELLEMQALRRMESGHVSDVEAERLGNALIDLSDALERIKADNGIGGTVREIHGQLDDLVDDVLDRLVNPERWADNPN